VAKKPAAVYEPGELDRVRRNLGDLDPNEAKRIASLLGGEVGVEKAPEPPGRERRVRDETVSVSVKGRGAPAPRRRVETADPDDGRTRRRSAQSAKSGQTAADPADDPETPVKLPYRERLRIDRYMAQSEFDIKNSGQVFYSMISLFGEPPDVVNPAFVTGRMNEYYARLELLVTATRTMLPRNNVVRAELLKSTSPFAFKTLDVIRQWNIEKIAAELSRIQSKPREAVVGDFSELLKMLYRPLYLLGNLDPETHIRDAYHVLYKLLTAENAVEAKEKHNAQFRSALSAYVYVSRSVRYLLYPLLLKLLSDRWLSFEDLFVARRRRFESFIGVRPSDRLEPPSEQERSEAASDAAPAAKADVPAPAAAAAAAEEFAPAVDQGGESAPEKAPPPRAWTRGIDALEGIFPGAGWQGLDGYPDLYPYFADVFDLKKGFELVAPNDPLQQIVALMHILEELFYGLRFVQFGTVTNAAGDHERADEIIPRIIGSWHGHLEETLGKEYLPRLSEYARLADESPESRVSNYAKRMLAELLWVKRLNFLPFLRFETAFSTHPFRKKEEKPFYAEVRELRRLLTGVASGIEAGIKNGGAASGAPCDGIDNPWEPYVFQLPNPVSMRLDAILGGKNSRRKTNAALVFFTLSAVSVLDLIVNDKSGYAYADSAVCPFRSLEGDGVKPLFGVDARIDADALFKQSLKARAGGPAAG